MLGEMVVSPSFKSLERMVKMTERSGRESDSLQVDSQISPVGHSRKYSDLQHHFLSRLNFLINERTDAPDSQLESAVSRVIYSTFQDCLNLDVGSEARAILRGEAFQITDQTEK